MKKMLWAGVVVFVVMIGTLGCSLDRDVSPTGPANVVSMINAYVGGGMPGDLYTVYNEETQFGVSLGSGWSTGIFRIRSLSLTSASEPVDRYKASDTQAQ